MKGSLFKDVFHTYWLGFLMNRYTVLSRTVKGSILGVINVSLANGYCYIWNSNYRIQFVIALLIMEFKIINVLLSFGIS